MSHLIVLPDLVRAKVAQDRRFQRRRATLFSKLKELEEEDCEGVVIVRRRGSTMCNVSGELTDALLNGTLDLSNATVTEPCKSHKRKHKDMHAVVERAAKAQNQEVELETPKKFQTPGRGFLPVTSIRSSQLAELQCATLCATTPEKT